MFIILVKFWGVSKPSPYQKSCNSNIHVSYSTLPKEQFTHSQHFRHDVQQCKRIYAFWNAKLKQWLSKLKEFFYSVGKEATPKFTSSVNAKYLWQRQISSQRQTQSKTSTPIILRRKHMQTINFPTSMGRYTYVRINILVTWTLKNMQENEKTYAFA